MRLPSLLSILCLTSVLTSTMAATAAPSDPADALFYDGVKDMNAKHFEEGCPKLQESYRLNPRPGTVFALADCEAGRGRIASAVARYDEYLAMYDALPPAKKVAQEARKKEALAQKAALTPQVPELTLVLPPSAPSATVVKRDGAELSPTALHVALAVDPGEHFITTQVPGEPVAEVRVTLAKGEKQTITLEIKGAPETPVPTPKRNPPPENGAPSHAAGTSGRRVGAYVAGGVGVAGLVLGGVTGALALGKKNIIEKNCVDIHCNHEGYLAAESNHTFGLISTIGFGVGAAGIAAGVTLLLTAPSRPKTGVIKPWVTADVLDAGPHGAVMGMKGAF